MELTDKIVKNIEFYMLNKKISIDDLSISSGLSKRRLKSIFNIGVKRRVTINEIYIISLAIRVPIKKLVDVSKTVENTG